MDRPQGYSEEEKIKILYEKSLRDIRELTTRMESTAAVVQAAAEEVNAGRSESFEKNHELVKKYVQALADFTNKHLAHMAEVNKRADELLDIKIQAGIEELASATRRAREDMRDAILKERNEATVGIRVVVATVVKEEITKIDEAVRTIEPTLNEYASRVGKLISDLDKHAAAANIKIQSARSDAGYVLVNEVNAQLKKLCIATALAGGAGATIVLIISKLVF